MNFRRRAISTPRLLAALSYGLLALALACHPSMARAASSADLLRADYLRLKERFEAQARQNTDPRVLSCLAVETVALSWTLAAAQLTEDEDARREWRTKAAEFETSWDEAKTWDARHLRALELYYEALTEVDLYLVTQGQRQLLAKELTQIENQTQRQLQALSDREDPDLEKRVVLSGALVSLASVATRSLGGAPMEEPVAALLQALVLKSGEIQKRSDLHYRAKLSLLYANNLKGLTTLVFLLGQTAGPPLSRELALIHRSLNQYGQGHSLPYANSLVWVAQAQAVLPLAYWLATH